MCLCNVIKHYEYLKAFSKEKNRNIRRLVTNSSSSQLSAIAELILNVNSVSVHGDDRKPIQQYRHVANKLKNKEKLKLATFRTFITENKTAIKHFVRIVLNHLVETELIKMQTTCNDVPQFSESASSDQ